VALGFSVESNRWLELLLTCCCCCCLPELKQHQNADKQEIDRLRRQFKDMTAVVWQVFGPDSCR
jgi:hypothetical protein